MVHLEITLFFLLPAAACFGIGWDLWRRVKHTQRGELVNMGYIWDMWVSRDAALTNAVGMIVFGVVLVSIGISLMWVTA